MIKSLLAASAAVAIAAGAIPAVAQAPSPSGHPNLIGIAAAVAAAESSLGARAFDAELDREKGVLLYEIKLVKDGKAVEARVDAQTGKLIQAARPLKDRLPWTREDLWAAQSAPHNLTQAISRIESSTKGRVTDIGLERRAGRAYYDVELAGAPDRDILVDIQTGAITPVIDD